VDGLQYGHVDDFIPFESSASGRDNQQRGTGPEYSKLKDFDLSNIMRLPVHESRRVATVKLSAGTGMSGDTADLQQNLYACVRVGRLDRAAGLVRRIAKIYQPSAPELQDAHGQYLLGLLDDFLSSPTKDKYTAMQKWFELDIRVKDVPLTGPILAVMIKATLCTLDGTRLERTLRRYMNYADQADVEMDTLSSSVFTEAELNRILRLMPDRYEKPDEVFQDNKDSLIEPPSSADVSAGDPVIGADDVTELRAHTQKGLGLVSLRKSMHSISTENKDGQSDLSPQAALHARQLHLERDVISAALERWQEEAETTQRMRALGSLSDPQLGTYVHGWLKEMTALLKEELKRCDEAEQGRPQADEVPRLTIGPILRIMPPEKLCAAALMAWLTLVGNKIPQKEVDKANVTGSVISAEYRPLTKTVKNLGDAITEELEAEIRRDDMLRKFSNLPSSERRKKLSQLSKRPTARYSHRKPMVQGEHSLEEGNGSTKLEFTVSIRVMLGAYFVSLLTKVAKLPVTKKDPRTGESIVHVQRVITQGQQWRNGKRLSMIRLNPALLQKMRKEPIGHFISKPLPMLIEPQKWTRIDSSPYLATPQNAIRFKDRSLSQKEYARRATENGSMDQVFKGLDVLGKVPWRINGPVFKVLSVFWNSGDDVAGIAPEDSQSDFPPEPEEGSSFSERLLWKQKVIRIENENKGMHSKRCFQNFQFEIAKTYLNEVFYTPHSVDFRGRAYPIPPYFNHMGADTVRGLFLFAKGRELGEHGLYWLKVHLANVYGYDKQSLAERAQFAEDHVAEIYDSATNPIDGKRWWLTSEDPWQTLAACMELKNALDSPVPEKYLSHLPVQQDGTCNGLQHYAALGGDMIGARQVNLMPGDRPADIYSAVAEMVKETVARDAKDGSHFAQVVDGYITRKVVKQPVMTNVYGVTAHGARAQIARQLLDVLPQAVLDTETHIIPIAAYVARLVFNSLNKMFNGAQAIQVWLGECGARISSAVTPEQIRRIQARRNGVKFEEGKFRKILLANFAKEAAKEDYQFKSAIVWTTPLGLPVVQPYRKEKPTLIKTNLQDLYLNVANLSNPVEKRKQLQAFPPNFIHSLDATHMMLSALKCDEIGVQFASVHDSFWTHAADVPRMNNVLRDSFIRMHSEDIITRLRQEFIARYAGCYWYAQIHVESEGAKRLLAFRKSRGAGASKFHKSYVDDVEPVDELLEEYERAQMLASSDPEVRAKGLAMQTAGSIVEEMGPEALAEALILESDYALRGVKAHNQSSFEDHDVEDDDVPELEAEEASVNPEPMDDFEPPMNVEQLLDSADPGPEIKRGPKRKTRSKAPKLKVHVWLPVEFPEAPPKGGFDVARLKDSQYFFS